MTNSDETGGRLLPFRIEQEILVSMSNADTDIIGWFHDANVVGIVLDQARTYKGTKVGSLVVIPWTSIVYAKLYERERAE